MATRRYSLPRHGTEDCPGGCMLSRRSHWIPGQLPMHIFVDRRVLGGFSFRLLSQAGQYELARTRHKVPR